MKKLKGFTIIELVVVMTIIGIFMAAISSTGCCKKKKKLDEVTQKCVEGVIYNKEPTGIWVAVKDESCLTEE